MRSMIGHVWPEKTMPPDPLAPGAAQLRNGSTAPPRLNLPSCRNIHTSISIYTVVTRKYGTAVHT